MNNLPLPVIIGAVMMVIGVGLGAWIIVSVAGSRNGERRNR
ncbi:MAG: hypothetical protein RLZZ229_27 [Actinomycetota bacterium]|jgi:xanthine/uracil permease